MNFVKGSFHISGDDHVISVLHPACMLNYIYQYVYVEPYLHHWNETDFIMVYDLFDMTLNLFANLLLRNCVLYSLSSF
jgi:hypothetical protein